MRQQAEAPADMSQQCVEMRHNNQPGQMRDDHTRECEGHNGVQGLKTVGGGMTTVGGGREGIKERMVQIKKRTTQQPARKVSMIRAADNGAGSRQ